MSEHVLETCYSIKEAMRSIKNKLIEIDKKNLEMWSWYKENMPEEIQGKTMEEKYIHEHLYLVFRNDYFVDECWVFQNTYNIESWLDNKWTDWGLWEYDDPNEFLEDNLVIWCFHRNACKKRWGTLYKNSKPFIEGWSRKREYASFEAVPSFSVN